MAKQTWLVIACELVGWLAVGGAVAVSVLYGWWSIGVVVGPVGLLLVTAGRALSRLEDNARKLDRLLDGRSSPTPSGRRPG